MGYIAVFIALSGSAYAATAAKNSVVSRSIKDGQVKTADLGNGAVTNPKLGAGAVTNAKLGNGAVDAAKIANKSIEPAAMSTDLEGLLDSRYSMGSGFQWADAEAPPAGFGGSAQFEDPLYPGTPVAGLAVACPADPTTQNSSVQFQGMGTAGYNLFEDSGLSSPTFESLSNGGDEGAPDPMTPNGDEMVYHFQTASFAQSYVGTIFVESKGRAADCHFQAQAFVTRY